MKALAPFALGLSPLTGCRNAPELTTLPDPPTGLAVSWAFDDCAPWDGAATTIYLASTTASEPRNAPYPHAWVSLYRPVTEVTGRTFRSDRRIHRPWGVQGGGAGTPGENVLIELDREVAMPSKFSTRSAPGATISIRTPGGGGFGSPVGGSRPASFKNLCSQRRSQPAR